MIRERDKSVLRDVARIAESEDVTFFVIGAGARFLVYDWPNDLTGGRGTTDWDIAARVSSWEVYDRLRCALTCGGLSISDHTRGASVDPPRWASSRPCPIRRRRERGPNRDLPEW